MQKKGNKYGVHRVIEPKGLMTQAAKKIDNTMECWSNEILCDVSALNIDSASFTQIYEACEKDLASIIDGAHTYTWCVQERELDVEVAVEVQGGMVQNIYANADVWAEVYDLDLTDIQEEGGPTEGELRQAALTEEVSKPGWRVIS